MPGKSKARRIIESELREAAQVALATTQSRYAKALDRKAHGYALLGHSNEEIAELFGVERNTIARWVVEHASFAAALHKARNDDNVAIVKALHRAAKGYRYRETKLNVVNGKLEKTEVTKAYPPSVQAATILLTNRVAQHWKDTKSVEHTGQVNLSHLVESSIPEAARPIAAQVIENGDNDEES